MITKREAIIKLLSINKDTIIDLNWFSYLIESEILLALYIITDLNSYNQILNKYEGYSINELLNEILNK